MLLTGEMDLRALPVLDVGVYPVPFDDVPVAVVQRVRAHQKPAIFAVGSTKPGLRLPAFAGSNQRAPNRRKAAEIVRVDRRHPTRLPHLPGGEPHVIEIVLIYEIDRTVGAG
jgi:hypothetical protein